MPRRNRPQKKERAQTISREYQRALIKGICARGQATLLKCRGSHGKQESYYWGTGLVKSSTHTSNVFHDKVFVFQRRKNGHLILECTTQDHEFDLQGISEWLSANQIYDDYLPKELESELVDALQILNQYSDWSKRLQEVVAKYQTNPNTLLGSEKPVLNPSRIRLLATLKYQVQGGWIVTKLINQETREESFKWISDQLPIGDLNNVLVLTRGWGNQRVKLQPIEEEYDLTFLIQTAGLPTRPIGEEESRRISEVLSKISLVSSPWTDALDCLENFLNNYVEAEPDNGYWQVPM
jgi:hypothetical protein